MEMVEVFDVLYPVQMPVKCADLKNIYTIEPLDKVILSTNPFRVVFVIYTIPAV